MKDKTLPYLECLVLFAWLRYLPEQAAREFDALMGKLKPEDVQGPQELIDLVYETGMERLRRKRRRVLITW